MHPIHRRLDMPEPANSIPEIGATATIGELTVNYHDCGAGDPVLLIHGSGPGVTAWANWRLTIPALEDRFRVIAPDMAGFGYTDPADDVGFSKKMWVDQLTGLLDLLDIGAVSIVGNSFGGAIALEFARTSPDRCTRIVLMGAVGTSFPLTVPLDAVWGYTPSLDAMGQMLPLFVYDKSMVTEDLVEMRYRASVRPTVQERFSKLFPHPRQRWVDALAQSDEALAGIHHPVLVVHGVDDEVIPYDASVRLANLLPNAELHSIENCGHWVQIEQKDAFNAILRDFLSAPEALSELANKPAA